ncbi:MAG: ABC transporter ATP-binding protein [Spirochaetia bacterium]|jgi:iron complex transport system ATP-binding protein|nr:ABC transporter ATP-binding protein [Spirochaetia bacterium]
MAVEVRGVSFNYAKIPILRGICFHAKKGEFFCILGPNGSGKTTLIKRICALHGAQGKTLGGSIRLAGRPLESLKRRDIARLIAVVPQRSSLPGGLSVRETVEMGLYAVEANTREERAAVQSRVDSVMETLGLLQYAGRDIYSLSGGEFQKVLLARALAQNPEILILDEATAHLDIHHAIEIFTLVKNLTRRKALTVLAVVHDINLAAGFADRIMLLDRGRCAGTGTPKEILTAQLLQTVFHIQARVLLTEEGGIAVLPSYPHKEGTLWN